MVLRLLAFCSYNTGPVLTGHEASAHAYDRELSLVY